jgi:hypothetical protein
MPAFADMTEEKFLAAAIVVDRFANTSQITPRLGVSRHAFSKIAPKFPLRTIWHGPCNVSVVAGWSGSKDPPGRFQMTYYSSSLAAQFGVGVMSFLVSVTCILAAVGPAHIAG